MAHSNVAGALPFKAASSISQWVPVIGLEGSSSIDETVRAQGSINQFPIGMTIATVASPGDPVSVAMVGSKAKAIAGASLGAFTPVQIGSTNGILVPVARGGGAASTINQQIGWAVQSAAAGDVFTIFVDPKQIV